MTLPQRRLDFTIRLGQGAFGASGHNTLKLSGLRASASINNAGGFAMINLQARIFGMSLDHMNAASTLGKPIYFGRDNRVTVEASSDDGFMSTVYEGTIFQAWADMQSAPDIGFTIEANTGQLDAMRPLAPTSFRGSVDAATVIGSLANKMGLRLEDNGVKVQLPNAYYAGTGRDQVARCAEDAHLNFSFEPGIVAIWPKGGARNKPPVLISPDKGMVGYPAWTANGLVLTTAFNPTVTLGGYVQVESAIKPARGRWYVNKVDHDLESEMPGGRWFTRVEAVVVDHPTVPR